MAGRSEPLEAGIRPAQGGRDTACLAFLIGLVLATFARGPEAQGQPTPTPLECGELVSLETLQASQVVEYSFEGLQGQLARFELDRGEPGIGASSWTPRLSVRDPNNQVIGFAQGSNSVELSLQSAGPYRITVGDAFGSGWGQAQIRWQSIVPPLCAQELQCGDRVAGAILQPQFRRLYRFDGLEGDVVALVLERSSSTPFWGPNLQVFDRHGQLVTSYATRTANSVFRLPEDGPYSVSVGKHPLAGAAGSFRLSLDWLSPPERSCALRIGCGERASGATTHDGDHDILLFEGEAGDYVHVDLESQPGAQHLIHRFDVYAPGSDTPFFYRRAGSWSFQLNETGPYAIVVHDADYSGFGEWTLDLEWLLPIAKSCAPRLEDCVSAAGTARSRNDVEYFNLDGDAGDVVTIDLDRELGEFGWGPTIALYDEDGLRAGNPLDGPAYTLPTTGHYVLAIRSDGARGTFRVTTRRNGQECSGPPTTACGAPRSVRFLDPLEAPFQAPPQSPTDLLGLDREVVGLAADGVTPIFVRVDGFVGPGDVTLRVADDRDETAAESVGALSDPLGTSTGNPLIVPLHQDPSTGEWFAFARLTAPTNFTRGPGDDEAALRTLLVLAQGPGACAAGELVLLRPPVLLVHGFLGQRETWRWPSLYRSGSTDYRVGGKVLPPFVQVHDYRLTNAGPMRGNVDRLQLGIESALRRFRGYDPVLHAPVAATQVDLVAHSYGAVVSRLYCADVNGRLRRAENLLQGDVHKLITLGAPHWGSPWADLVASLLSIPVLGDAVAFLAQEVGACLDCGAVHDMRQDVLEDVPRAIVPVHAIYGTGIPDLIASGTNLPDTVFEDELTWALDQLAWIYDQTSLDLSSLLFAGDEHDLLVAAGTAQGGLTSPHTTEVSGVHAIHSFMQKSWHVESIVRDLLNARLDLSDPTSAFAPQLPPGPALTPLVGRQPGPSLPIPHITTVLPGAIELVPLFGVDGLDGGDVVPLEIRGVGGYQPRKVAVLAGGELFLRDEEPFLVFVRIPPTLTGLVPVYAMALDAGHDLGLGADLLLTLNPASSLVSVEVAPDPVVLTVDSPTVQVAVRARYEDGSLRHVKPDDPAVVFSADSPGVATIDGEGRVSAVAPGVGSVTVIYGTASNGTRSAQVPVHVVTDQGDGGNRALALRRDGLTNSGALRLAGPSLGRPVLGSSIELQLDHAATGHMAGTVSGYLEPRQRPFLGGQLLGVDLSSPRVLSRSLVPGADSFTVAIPTDASLTGIRVHVQGALYGGAPVGQPPLRLTNIWDLRLGVD